MYINLILEILKILLLGGNSSFDNEYFLKVEVRKKDMNISLLKESARYIFYI